MFGYDFRHGAAQDHRARIEEEEQQRRNEGAQEDGHPDVVDPGNGQEDCEETSAHRTTQVSVTAALVILLLLRLNAS